MNKEEELETIIMAIDKIINPKKFNYNKEEKIKMKKYILPVLKKELKEIMKEVPEEKRKGIEEELLIEFLTN